MGRTQVREQRPEIKVWNYKIDTVPINSRLGIQPFLPAAQRHGQVKDKKDFQTSSSDHPNHTNSILIYFNKQAN